MQEGIREVVWWSCNYLIVYQCSMDDGMCQEEPAITGNYEFTFGANGNPKWVSLLNQETSERFILNVVTFTKADKVPGQARIVFTKAGEIRVLSAAWNGISGNGYQLASPKQSQAAFQGLLATGTKREEIIIAAK